MISIDALSLALDRCANLRTALKAAARRTSAARGDRRAYDPAMVQAILNVIRMTLGLLLDIITLPFRALFALLGGAEFEFQRFSRSNKR